MCLYLVCTKRVCWTGIAGTTLLALARKSSAAAAWASCCMCDKAMDFASRDQHAHVLAQIHCIGNCSKLRFAITELTS